MNAQDLVIATDLSPARWITDVLHPFDLHQRPGHRPNTKPPATLPTWSCALPGDSAPTSDAIAPRISRRRTADTHHRQPAEPAFTSCNEPSDMEWAFAAATAEVDDFMRAPPTCAIAAPTSTDASRLLPWSDTVFGSRADCVRTSDAETPGWKIVRRSVR